MYNMDFKFVKKKKNNGFWVIPTVLLECDWAGLLETVGKNVCQASAS